MDSKLKITSKDCLHLANDIIVSRNLLIPRLTSIKDIDYSLIQMIFEDIFDVNFNELIPIKPNNRSQEIQFMARMLFFTSEELFCISLDHIRAEDIVDKNLVSINNLLEIISTFIKYIPKKFSKSKDISIEQKFESKSFELNDSDEEFDTKHLFKAFDERKRQRLRTLESTSSSSPTESIQSIRPLRRCSLRQLNSCIGSDTSNRRQEKSQKLSKSIQTDIETQTTPKRTVTPKTESPKDINFDEYKRLKCENFATLLGHRLHETLKLKELTDSIEYKIKKYYGDVTAKTPQRIGSKSSSMARSARKHSLRQKKSPQIRKTPIKLKSSPKTSSLDELIKHFPEIPRNTIKTLKVEEKQQKKVMENLNKEVFVKQLRVKSQLKDAIEEQEKRSQLIRNEIKQMQTLAETKGSKISKIKENASKRDSRIERARMQKMLDKYQNDLNSKYLKLRSIEEQIVLKEFDKRQKQQKESIEEFRQRIRERHSQEMEKQKKMLESFETLYQNKYQMLSENLSEEEKRLKNEINSQSYYLRSIKREFNQKFDSDFGALFKT